MFIIVKWGAPSRWSFRPISAWGKHRDDDHEEGAPYFRKYIYVWNPRTEPKVSIVLFLVLWVRKCHKIAKSTKMSEMALKFFWHFLTFRVLFFDIVVLRPHRKFLTFYKFLFRKFLTENYCLTFLFPSRISKSDILPSYFVNTFLCNNFRIFLFLNLNNFVAIL